MSLLKKPLLLLLLTMSAIVIYQVFSYTWFAYTPASNDLKTTETLFQVHPGHSPKKIAKTLYNKKIILNENRFYWLGRFTSKWSQIKTGEYFINPEMTPLELFQVLTSGVSVLHEVVIQEGLNMYQIADLLEKKGLGNKELFISLCQDSRFIQSLGLDASIETLEGYLFPETYQFTKSLKEVEIIKIMFKQFNLSWKSSYSKEIKKHEMSQHQLITLASMIEKETGAPQERTLISSVFHNRLNKKMRLESDPTTIYGIWHRFNGNLTRKDLKEETPFNTYKIKSLPKGPIANPGKEAIFAALFPKKSDFLFFVSKNDGTHKFSKNYSDHLKAVKKFQLDPKKREGKSWRQLLNKD